MSSIANALSTNRRLRDNVQGYVFILPWIVGFLAFTLIPMITSFYISFTRYNLISEPIYVGLRNFRFLLQDARHLQSIRVTITYVLTAVPLRLVFALAVAMFLVQRRRFIGVYRLVYYLPSIVGTSVGIAVVWREFFGRGGPIAYVITVLTGEPFNLSLVGLPSTAIWTVIALYVWQFGSSMLIFLAGLKNIPDTLYESAIIDGAGSITKFFRITLPMLTPVLLFNIVMQTIHGFMVFTQVIIITGGGPIDSTLVYVLYMYRRAFEFYDMGTASAMALLLFIALSLVVLVIFKTSNRWVYYESGEGK